MGHFHSKRKGVCAVYIIRLKPLLVSLAISLGVGLIAGLLTSGSMDFYQEIQRPPLSPPGWVFPVAWTLLYLLMGLSSYLVWNSESLARHRALTLYGAQLGVNFLWPIFFFCLHWIFFSFLWLAFLWILVAFLIRAFLKVNKLAAYLQIPYLIWLTFAGYLNLGIFFLN
ncbi:MAG: tryptophan-rich sensory protein [Clostridiales bacterium]|nr:tryptophan-rich sensory protein [Clostridiales bacterium]